MRISKLGVFCRGTLMGVAEIVPGISGGTVAFITGIYPILISSIASFGIKSLELILSPKEFFKYHNVCFLLTLILGMMFGIFLFSNLMSFLLNEYRPIVWGMFFGFIIGSVFFIGRERKLINLLIYGTLGSFLGLVFIYVPEPIGELDYFLLFLVSMVAVCAWILPGVSGSFVLLALGYYSVVIEAVSNFQVDILLVLMTGLISGLLVFTKFLRWLLTSFEDQLFSGLAGVMLGSVIKLWPWQLPKEDGISSFVSPEAYHLALGQSPFALITIAAFFLGFFILWLLAAFRTP